MKKITIHNMEYFLWYILEVKKDIAWRKCFNRWNIYAVEQVKKSDVPILFIHGDSDDFVPEYMCEELYEVADCKKDKLIIHSAGHTEAKYKEPEIYYNKIFEFLENID